MKKPEQDLDRLFPMELRRAQQAAKIEALQVKALEIPAWHLERLAALDERISQARIRAEALRLKRGPKGFRFKKPPPDEGGEPVPALPRPKPTPLSGGAAARLIFEERKPRAARPREVLSVSRPESDTSRSKVMTVPLAKRRSAPGEYRVAGP